MNDKLKKKIEKMINESPMTKDKDPIDKKKMADMIDNAVKIKDALLKDGRKAMVLMSSADSILITIRKSQTDGIELRVPEFTEMLIATLILYEKEKIIKIL